MSEKITFFIFGTAGTPVKQVAASKTLLYLMGFFAISCATALGFGAYDYYNFKMSSLNNGELENRVRNQQDEIAVQRKQIQIFANKINSLKSKLLALNDFEKQIRTIAGIERSDKQTGIFGVGGSMPEDIETNVELTEKHNSLMREMHDQVKQLDLASVNQEDRFEYLLKHLVDRGNLLAHTPAIRPVRGIITSKFGYRTSPFTAQGEFHKGLDIANRKGTRIVAVADGTVSFADVKGFWGKLMIINHGHGMTTYYAHLHKFLKKAGDSVKRGEVIAQIGNTGRTTGPHLHYEVRLNGTPVNPEKYILN